MLYTDLQYWVKTSQHQQNLNHKESSMATISATNLENLGKMAFAIAVNRACPGVFPNAEKVEFTRGVLYHGCRYDTEKGLIFKGGFYHRDLHDTIGGSICIGEIEDHHGPQLYAFPFSWYHIFNIPTDYDLMKDQEIIEWASDENSRHMQQTSEIMYLFEWLLRDKDRLVDGTTKVQIAGMTLFQRIELLERLCIHTGMYEHQMLPDISRFVDEIKPYKDGFRTAEDMYRL